MKKMQGSGNRPSLRGRSGAVYANFFLSFFAGSTVSNTPPIDYVSNA